MDSRVFAQRKRSFWFGDIHFPFHHKVVLPLAVFLAIKQDAEVVCQVGDLRDWYSAAKFPRSYNVFTPKHEQQWSSYYAELFWQVLATYLPKAKKYQLMGNHCVRPHKRIIEVAPEFEEDIITMLERLYTFDGVKTIFDPREELYIDDVCAMHGYFTGPIGRHAAFNFKNFVCGHTHRGGTAFIRHEGHEGGALWELNAGYLADPFAKGLGYPAQRRATNWTWGLGHSDSYGPRFIPLHPEMAKRFRGNPLFEELLKAFG